MFGPEMLKVGAWLLARETIQAVDLSELESLIVRVHHSGGVQTTLRNHQAIDFVMELRPSALEGRSLRFARHAWAFHNLIAHPLLQVLTWFGARQLGLRVHDATVPKPIGSRIHEAPHPQ